MTSRIGTLQWPLPRALWLRTHAQFLVVFAGALAIRVTYNLTIARHYVPVSDAHEYVLLGQHLLAGKCYCLWGDAHPTTYRSPGFPLFLAAVFAVAGPTNTLAARLALSVVGAGTCVLTSLIARDLFGPRAALPAGLIAATYPQLFINDAWLNSESLATFLFAASCLAIMRVVKQPPGWRWLAAGALLGLTALTRPNGAYALGAALLWVALAIWRRWQRWRRGTLAAALLVAGFLVVVAPWTARNYVATHGAFVPLSTGGGIVIAGAYTDLAYKGPHIWSAWFNPWRNPTWSASDREALSSFPPNCWGRCEVVRDEATTAIGLRWARAHLIVLPWLVVLRWAQLWIPANAPDNGGMPIWRPFAIGYPALVIALAAVGLYTLRRRWREALVPCLCGAAIVAGCLILYGSPRMRAMLEPLLVAWATGALLWLYDRFRFVVD
jgi:4-amino-4-deoxy-L-arabinose transferase-like glycosyltransferase